MRMRVLRSLTVLAAAAAALSFPSGPAPAGATAGATAPTTTGHRETGPIPGAHISPWGDAHVDLSVETLRWMRSEGITLEAIRPFRLDADGEGFGMPMEAPAAGDGLDESGRIHYPGGLRLHHRGTGKTLTLAPMYITVMPSPSWSARVRVGERTVAARFPLGDTKYEEVMADARPSATGYRLRKAPFYVTEEASRMFADETGHSGPGVGSLFGTLTPDFDHIPGAGTAGSRPEPSAS